MISTFDEHTNAGSWILCPVAQGSRRDALRGMLSQLLRTVVVDMYEFSDGVQSLPTVPQTARRGLCAASWDDLLTIAAKGHCKLNLTFHGAVVLDVADGKEGSRWCIVADWDHPSDTQRPLFAGRF